MTMAFDDPQGDVGDRTERRPTHRMPRAMLLLAGVVLTWLVVSNSLMAYLGNASPGWATALYSEAPNALVRDAERRMVPLRKEWGRVKRALARADQQAAAPTNIPPAQSDVGGVGRNDPAEPARAGGRTSEPIKDADVDPEFDLSEIDQIEMQVAKALSIDPLSAQALRIMGEIADIRGDITRAHGLIEAAASIRKHETVAVYHALIQRAAAGDFSSALDYADLLLRTKPEAIASVMPVLVKIAESREHAALLKRKVAANPPWLSRFLFNMLSFITDARTPLEYYLALKDAGIALPLPEFRGYLQFLVQHGFYDVAYYAWLQFLPPARLSEIGHLYNGKFTYRSRELLMDWTLRSGNGAQVEIAPHSDDGDDPGLRVELGPGRIQFGEVSQLVLLAPGQYRLKGKFRGEVNGRRGLRWRLMCASRDNKSMIAETPMLVGLFRTWRELDVEFEVPRSNCGAQRLVLVHDARYSAEQFVNGVMWFDDLAIDRSK